MRAPTPRFDKFRTIAKESHACLYSELDVISTKWSEAERVEKSPSTTQHCSLSGRFLGYSLREFGLRRPLEMTDIGNVLKARNNMFWKCTNRTKQQQFNVSTCSMP